MFYLGEDEETGSILGQTPANVSGSILRRLLWSRDEMGVGTVLGYGIVETSCGEQKPQALWKVTAAYQWICD